MVETIQRLIKEKGQLPCNADIGGYPLFYADIHMEVHCPTCANKHKEEIVLMEVNWEDAELTCAICSDYIDSAYGEKEGE